MKSYPESKTLCMLATSRSAAKTPKFIHILRGRFFLFSCNNSCVLGCGKVRKLSEGLVLAMVVLKVVVMVRVVKMVGLMSIVAVTDDWMINPFTLQLFLLVNSFQLPQQLSDKGLRRSTATTAHVTHNQNTTLC